MLIGKDFGGYRILAKTQIGEAGPVYKALHTGRRQTYALKLLCNCLVEEDRAHRQLLEKLRIAATLDHSCIARTYPAELAGDLTLIPLEFVYGQNLSDKIVEGPAAMDFALRIAMQAAEALQLSHEHGLVHGRLTSNTLLVGPEGNLKIVDFAFDTLAAEMLFSDPDNGAGTSAWMPIRPPLSRLAYRAPEQIQGNRADVCSDLFSLGVIVYELLAGQFLFESDNLQELDRQILERDLPKISQVRPEVPSSWAKLLRGLLDKRPTDRYPSAQAVLEDLHKLNYGAKLDRLSFQNSKPALSRRSFFRRFMGEQEE